LRTHPHLSFAGQVTGVEGYVESAAIGLLAGRFAAAALQGRPHNPPPPTTAFGALLAHITGGADARTFQPMNVNFGLFPDLDAQGRMRGKDRKHALAKRALDDVNTWLGPDLNLAPVAGFGHAAAE
jgi:methylenetetrahydrofolate--tRNA-(uracil-5-)-methyltransferase